MALGPSPESLNGTCFRFRMMSVASSTTPGMDWNSCSTPSILTAVMAAPSMDESSTRRRLLPMVVPKPRSNGCAQKRAYLSFCDSVSTARRLGFWNPLHNIVFLLSALWLEQLGGDPDRRLRRKADLADVLGLTSNTTRRSVARSPATECLRAWA